MSIKKDGPTAADYDLTSLTYEERCMIFLHAIGYDIKGFFEAHNLQIRITDPAGEIMNREFIPRRSFHKRKIKHS
jgi:hypothetical protein